MTTRFAEDVGLGWEINKPGTGAIPIADVPGRFPELADWANDLAARNAAATAQRNADIAAGEVARRAMEQQLVVQQQQQQQQQVKRTTCPSGQVLVLGRCVSAALGNPWTPETSKQPGTTMPYTPYTPYNNTVGQIGTLIGGSGLCDTLPPGYKEACKAAAAIAGGIGGGGGGGGALTQQCSQGWTWNATLGKCVQIGNALPGGQPLTLGGGPVATTGGLGLSAVTPTQVGVIQRKDGSTGPILKCPRKYVLGQDYLCYPKSLIPNQLRAHPRGTRPLLTGGEVKILRRAKGLSKKVNKIKTEFGTKVCHCGPTKARKRK